MSTVSVFIKPSLIPPCNEERLKLEISLSNSLTVQFFILEDSYINRYTFSLLNSLFLLNFSALTVFSLVLFHKYC